MHPQRAELEAVGARKQWSEGCRNQSILHIVLFIFMLNPLFLDGCFGVLFEGNHFQVRGLPHQEASREQVRSLS